MTGMLDWVRHALGDKPTYEVPVGEEASKPKSAEDVARRKTDETRLRYLDPRARDHLDDLD